MTKTEDAPITRKLRDHEVTRPGLTHPLTGEPWPDPNEHEVARVLTQLRTALATYYSLAVERQKQEIQGALWRGKRSHLDPAILNQFIGAAGVDLMDLCAKRDHYRSLLT